MNKFTYQLTELWGWYDASKSKAHDALIYGAIGQDCRLDQRHSSPHDHQHAGHDTATSRQGHANPLYGAVYMEYNNDSDACFDTKVVDGRVERGAEEL
jgi:hypothetical protein